MVQTSILRLLIVFIFISDIVIYIESKEGKERVRDYSEDDRIDYFNRIHGSWPPHWQNETEVQIHKFGTV